jgi:hypothetical protein
LESGQENKVPHDCAYRLVGGCLKWIQVIAKNAYRVACAIWRFALEAGKAVGPKKSQTITEIADSLVAMSALSSGSAGSDRYSERSGE